jgi:hypothetical protein
MQRLIDDSARFLGSKEVLRKLRNLEACSDENLPTEWELAILVAFSRFGTITGRRPPGEENSNTRMLTTDGSG